MGVGGTVVNITALQMFNFIFDSLLTDWFFLPFLIALAQSVNTNIIIIHYITINIFWCELLLKNITTKKISLQVLLVVIVIVVEN